MLEDLSTIPRNSEVRFRIRAAPMNHGSGEKSRYPDRPRISRVGVGSEWLKPVGVGRMNFTIGSDKSLVGIGKSKAVGWEMISKLVRAGAVRELRRFGA